MGSLAAQMISQVLYRILTAFCSLSAVISSLFRRFFFGGLRAFPSAPTVFSNLGISEVAAISRRTLATVLSSTLPAWRW